MLSAWFEVLPLFMARWFARRYCEQITQGGELFFSARPDCYFIETAQRAQAQEGQA